MIRSLALATAAAAALAACDPQGAPPRAAVARGAVIAGIQFDPPPPSLMTPEDCVPVGFLALGGTEAVDVIVHVVWSAPIELYSDPLCTTLQFGGGQLVIPAGEVKSKLLYFRPVGAGPGGINADAVTTAGPLHAFAPYEVADLSYVFDPQPAPTVLANEPQDVGIRVSGSGSVSVDLAACSLDTGLCRSMAPLFIYAPTLIHYPVRIPELGRWRFRLNAVGGAFVYSSSFVVLPAPPLTAETPAELSVRAGDVLGPVSVFVRDAILNPLPFTAVTVSLEGGALLGGTTELATDSFARVDFADLVVTTAGSYTLAWSADGTPCGSTALKVLPAAAVLTFDAAPVGSLVASSGALPVAVRVKDVYGNDHEEVVTIGVEDARQVSHGAPSQVLPTGGVATSSVVVTTAGTWYVRASLADGYGAYGATSGPFTITPAPPLSSGFTFTVAPPASAVAGASFSVGVRLVDPYLNPIATTVTLLLEPSSAASLTGTTSRATAPATGIASFGGLSIQKAGSYTVKASVDSPVALERSSGTVTVNPAAASGLAFVQLPPSAPTADDVFQVAVRVEDAYQNPVAATVDLGLHATNGAVLSVTTTTASLSRPTAAGVATFPDVAIRKAGGPYQLLASLEAPALVATSTDVTVSAGAAAALAFQDFQATTGTASFTLAPIQVAVEDAWGNLVASSSAPVTLGFESSPSGATLGGTATRTPLLGTATFSDIVLDTPGPHRFRATQEALSGIAPVDTVVYAPGSDFPAHHLAWATPPRTIAAGACSEAIRVEARDASDQRLRLLSPIPLALAGSGVAFFADATCDASPITTTELSRAGVAEFRARSAAVGGHQLAAQADLTCVNGCTSGVGVKSTVQDLVVQSGAGATSSGGTTAQAEAKPLNGWSTGCGAAGGAASPPTILGILAVVLARRRRSGVRAGIALLGVVALAAPLAAGAQPRTVSSTPSPAASSIPTATAASVAVPLPPPPTLKPRRPRDARPAAAILTLESSVPGEKLDVAALTDVFAAALDEPRWFRLVAPRDVTAALALERQKELLGCAADQSCLAELAGALGVDYVAAVSVGRVRDSLVVSARLIDPKRGVGVARSSVSADPEQLVAAVGDSARELLATYRAGRPADEQLRLVVPEGRGRRSSGRLALRVGGLFGYAPAADEGARGSVGGELGLSWRAGAAWTLAATGVAGPNPGFRLGVLRQLTGGALRLSAGLRGAGWPGAGAYGGGPVVEAALGLSRDLDLVGTLAAEGYTAEKRYGAYAALGGVGIAVRL